MPSNNNLSKPKKGWDTYFSKFIKNLKSLQQHESVTIIILLLAGFCIFTLGNMIQVKHAFIGHSVMTFAIIITLESVNWIVNHSILRKKIEKETDAQFDALKKEIAQQLTSLLTNGMDDLGEGVAKRLAGTKHIVESGIVNFLQEFDLRRVIEKCVGTTLFLQRFYFSTKEFELLESSLEHRIINCDCKVQIILLSPDQTEIIKDRVNNCSKYETSAEFSAGQIRSYLIKQIERLKAITEALPEDKRDYLQVKLYSGNIQASVSGYKDIIFAGKYLNNDVAEEGFQEMIEGENTKAYQVWHHYFSTNWQKATSI